MDAQYVLRVLLTARDDVSRAVENLNNRVGRSFDGLRDRFRGFGRDADDTGRRLRSFNRDADNAGTTLGRLFGNISNVSTSMQQMGQTAMGVRGILITLLLVAIQPLVTALLALVGVLVSVASSAVLAAGALGGVFLASITQAIPAVGLLVAAFARLGAVLEAVKLASKAQESASKDATSQMLRERAAADQIRAAQEQLRQSTVALSDAKLRQRDAQRNLIDARAEAIRQLQDLIFAEREAQLAAEGATLSQDEAQRRLQRSVRAGDTAAEIARNELGVRASGLDVLQARERLARATQAAVGGRQGGVEGQQVTVAARRELAQATRSVAEAERGVAEARRNLARANEDAARTGSELAASQEALNQALADLTPAERALMTAIQRLQAVYKEAFRPITDIIIGAFTDSVDMIVDVLQDQSVLGGFRALATGIATSIRTIMQGATSPEARAFWIFMMREGARNAPILARAFVQFATAMSRIATAASPLLRDIFDGLLSSMERFANFTADEDRLTSFFELAGEHLGAWKELTLAVLDLFGALIGTSAQSGLKIVEGISSTFRRWADDIRENKVAATAFFEDARKAAGSLWEIVVALGRAMFQIFRPESLNALKIILVDVVIPALTDAINIIGKVLELVGFLFGNETVARIARFALTVGLVVLGMNAFMKVAKLTLALFAVNPIVLFIAAILVIIYTLEKRWQVFSRLYEWLRENWSKLDDIILKPFRDAIKWITENWKTLLIAFFTGLPGLIWLALKSNWAKEFADKFKEELLGLKDWIKDKFIDPVVGFFKDLPGRFFGGIKDLGKGIAERIPTGDASNPSSKVPTASSRNVSTSGSTNLMGASPVMMPFAMAAKQFGLGVTSGLRGPRFPGDNSDHMYGKAIDVSNTYRGDPDGTPQMHAFFRWLLANSGGVRQAFYDPLGSIFSGRWSSYREGGHGDHVHVATYAHGGIVKPVPGGVYRVAEAGHPEMIIPLDPARRSRARQLMSLTKRVVGFADGGIPDVIDRTLLGRRISGTPQITVAQAAAMGFAELLSAIRRLGQGSRQLVRSMTNVLEELGLRFEDMRSDLETSVRRRALRLRQQFVGLVGGRATRLTDEAGEQRATLASLGETRDELLGERSQLNQALNVLRRRLRGAINPVVRRQLQASIAQLEGRILDNAEAVQDNLESQASAHERIAELERQAAEDARRLEEERLAEIERQRQLRLENISNAARKRLAMIDIASRVATFLGADEQLSSFNANVGRLGVLRSQLASLAGEGHTVAGGFGLGSVGLGGVIGQSPDGSDEANAVLQQILGVLEEQRSLQEQIWQTQVNEVQKSANRNLRFNDIWQRMATITGNSVQQIALMESRGRQLQEQIDALRALLPGALTTDQREDLALSIAELELALLENSEAVKDLTGATKAQTFTTTAWQLFRRAIFDGSGGLLPQFSVPDSGLMPSFAFGGVAQPAMGGPNQYHVHVTNPTETLDPGWVAKRFAFELRLNRK